MPTEPNASNSGATPIAAGATSTAPASGPFRWPEERPRATPPSAPLQPAPASGWERWSRHVVLALGIALSVWLYVAPRPVGLTANGQTAFAIFAFCTTLWVTQAIPFGVTGLLAVALLGLTRAMSPTAAFAAFGSPAVFFLIGVFTIGAALVESGLSKRCALLLLRRFERSPTAFANGMLIAAAFGTLWMPNQATSAMLFPIALEVAVALRLRPLVSSYAKILFLSLAWGAMVGSNASFLGSTRAPLALGMLQQKYGESIAFGHWVIAAAPVVLLGVLVAGPLLRFCFRTEPVDFASARAWLERTVRDLGPMRRREWSIAVILMVTVLFWVLLNSRVDLAVIALLSAAALFFTGALSWEQAERRIYWNIVLMYGGAIALGAVIDQSGAAGWLVGRVIGTANVSPFVAIAGILVGTLLLSEFMSNAAAVAVMLPLAFSLGDRFGVAPVSLVLATSIGAGLDFALPFSSAPNTIAFASGYLRMVDVLKAGALMTIVSVLIVLLVARLWWPLVGVL